MTTCDIIIPVWNRLEDTRACVEGIDENTSYPHRIILVDNGSTRETKEYLESLAAGRKDVVRIRNEENLGFVRAVNQALAASQAPYVCIMNNDTLPAAGWLERMVAFAERHPAIGLINPQCGGHGNLPVNEYARVLSRDEGKYMEMNQCQGFCMLVKREVIDRIGILDETFGIGGYDDTDYSMRAHLAGYWCAAIRDSYVYHRLHASFNVSGDREAWVRKNRAIYNEKWGAHVRAGIIVSGDDMTSGRAARIVAFAYGMAREWAWVHLWVNGRSGRDAAAAAIGSGFAAGGYAPHQNIKVDYFTLPAFLFRMTVAGKIIERARKRLSDKRFDGIVGFDCACGRAVTASAAMMRAQVIEVSAGDGITNWEKKGKEVALMIKEERNILLTKNAR